MTKVAIALSGGVDSLVSAHLLKQGFPDLFGIHFTTGYEPVPVDLENLEAQLGFPITKIDLSEEFEKTIVRYFVSTYMDGKTPNPCLYCNQEIKFGLLLEQARKLGADYLATGHYATIINTVSQGRSIPQPWLEKGKDPKKDQSYFLSRLTPEQLERVIFPLAGLTKPQVKALATENGLSPLTKGESQDICFIPDQSFSDFILKKLPEPPAPGPIKDLEGKVVGEHKGLHAFTIGQRRGINCPASEPYYVKKIDVRTNTLVVCFKKDLGDRHMRVRDLRWNLDPLPASMALETKIRYNHPGAMARVSLEKDMAAVEFQDPQFAVTPGQAAVFYQDNRVVGSGIIQ